MELAPQENCWGINSIIFERDVDLHFDMHREELLLPHQRERRDKIIEITNKKNIPVYSCDAIPGTTYIRYPIELVLAEFNTEYFSNGVCYMIALALISGVKEINFYGVNHTRLNMLDEYTLQKPGVDHWLGVCVGRKIPYYVHGAWSEIGRTFSGRTYGYDVPQGSFMKKYG